MTYVAMYDKRIWEIVYFSSGSVSAKNGGDVDIFYSIDYVAICDSRYIELQIT